MPLFACTKCRCIENTACAAGGYWINKMQAKDPLCSECMTGRWHGQFPKETATGMLLASDGFLYSKEDAVRESKRFAVQNIKIVQML
jgi:hypothetical protein